jgi:hypothetical protein
MPYVMAILDDIITGVYGVSKVNDQKQDKEEK